MTAPKLYRKKPEPPVEAVQWTGENIEEVRAFVDGERIEYADEGPLGPTIRLHDRRETPIRRSDYIFRKGSYLGQLREEVFQATYEEVADASE